MPQIHFDALPPRTTRSTIIRLMVQVGGIDRSKVGEVRVDGRKATAQVPERWAGKLATALDGSRLGEQYIRCWTELQAAMGDEEGFFRRLIRLLELEAKAEAERALRALSQLRPEQAERTGNSLCRLLIRDRTAGLGGRALITLGPRDPETLLPWTRLDAGSPVMLSLQQGGKGIRGVVSRRTPREIEAAFDRWPDEEESGPYRLDIASDEVSRQRQRRALERVESAEGSRLAELRKVLTGGADPEFPELAPVNTDAESFQSLNDSQKSAIEFALRAKDVAIIHGPPGTGKTTTVVEFIRQAVARGHSVLACAPSNMAVDNMLERLIGIDQDALRIGHPARVLPQLRERTLDLMVQAHPDMKLVKKIVQDARKLFAKADRFTRARPAPGEKKQLRDDAKNALAAARRIENQVVRSVVEGCQVLCATTTSIDSELLGQRRFDIAVIDEACQAVEPSCWIPLLRCDRVVLAGDHRQLPPTVVSAEAMKEDFHISMLERLAEQFGPMVTRQLDTQYRMSQEIMDFSSMQFYEGHLHAHESVATHRLIDLESVSENQWTGEPVQFIDTAGSGADEQIDPDGDSRLNPAEAQLVRQAVIGLLDAGLPAEHIAVITPYSAQVRHLRELLGEHDNLEVDTVDGFQGREKEAVLISLVRSNANGEIGFLADERRMNVALTRARRKLIVVGDSATIATHAFYQQLMDYFESIGAYHTVWEEPDLL